MMMMSLHRLRLLLSYFSESFGTDYYRFLSSDALNILVICDVEQEFPVNNFHLIEKGVVELGWSSAAPHIGSTSETSIQQSSQVV